MNKKLITGGVLAAMIMAGSAVGLAKAQSAMEPVAVSEAQAIEIALAEVPGAVQETELEREDGNQVYEIEIVNADGAEIEVAVDAQSGKVLDIEAEDGDDDCDKGKSGSHGKSHNKSHKNSRG